MDARELERFLGDGEENENEEDLETET